VIITVSLVGLAMTIALLGLIQIGTAVYDDAAVGQSIAFTAFALMLIGAAFECRSERDSIFTMSTFDSKQMNMAAAGEFVLAVLVTQMDLFHRLLGTVDIDAQQFGWALLPAFVLVLLWELGKLIARRRTHA